MSRGYNYVLGVSVWGYTFGGGGDPRTVLYTLAGALFIGLFAFVAILCVLHIIFLINTNSQRELVPNAKLNIQNKLKNILSQTIYSLYSSRWQTHSLWCLELV